MSWDSYIDNLLGQATGAVDRACIIGLDGSKWTTDGHGSALKLTAQESATIGNAMKTSNSSTFQTSGILLEGTKYQFLRMDETLCLGKKKDHGAVSMQKSKSAVVIAHIAEGQQQSNGNKAVGVIAEYLESLGM